MNHEQTRNQAEKKYFRSRLKASFSLRELYKNIQKDLSEVEDQLKLFAHSPNKLIAEINSYLFQKTGKRIRPALLMLCSKLLGYQGQEHILMSTIVEAIHTASLIHDDIIDNSKIRRGRESVHSRWGPNITVLLGDYIYIKSIGLSLQSDHRQITNILSEISAKMIEGELNEYYLSGNLALAERDYLDIIHKKTASLFSVSCQIGGILAQASEREEKYLREFGKNLGMSFQIIDDLLDFIGDEKTLGKPILSDISEGRVTLPLIYSLNNDGQANRKRLIKLLNEKKFEDDSHQEEILAILKANGALEYAYQKAEEFSARSKEIIAQFPPSIHRDALILFPDYILIRSR